MRNEYALPTSLLFFLPFSQGGFLVFSIFRALFRRKFCVGMHKIDDVAGSAALFFVPGEKKNESLKESKNGRPSRVVRPENRISSLLPENRF